MSKTFLTSDHATITTESVKLGKHSFKPTDVKAVHFDRQPGKNEGSFVVPLCVSLVACGLCMPMSIAGALDGGGYLGAIAATLIAAMAVGLTWWRFKSGKRSELLITLYEGKKPLKVKLPDLATGEATAVALKQAIQWPRPKVKTDDFTKVTTHEVDVFPWLNGIPHPCWVTFEKLLPTSAFLTISPAALVTSDGEVEHLLKASWQGQKLRIDREAETLWWIFGDEEPMTMSAIKVFIDNPRKDKTRETALYRVPLSFWKLVAASGGASMRVRIQGDKLRADGHMEPMFATVGQVWLEYLEEQGLSVESAAVAEASASGATS